MTISVTDVADFVSSTLENYGRGAWTDIAQTRQEYVALPNLLKGNNVIERSGQGHKWTVKYKQTGNARHTGLFETDNTSVDDLTTQAFVPFRFSETSYAFDVREEDLNSGDAEVIYDLITLRDYDATVDLADLAEAAMWSAPASSADTKTPWGVPYWLVYNATQGFNGSNPAGFSDTAGIDRTNASFSGWRNYSGQYTTVSKSDLVNMMRDGHRLCNWKSPVDVNDFRTGAGRQFQFYTNNAVLQDLEDMLESQNDNLGTDIAFFDQLPTFRRHPFVYVSYLDADSNNPVYGVNWDSFKILCARGSRMRHSITKGGNGQHNVVTVHKDISWNVLSHDPRRSMMFATGAS